jgi:hypothetical protein
MNAGLLADLFGFFEQVRIFGCVVLLYNSSKK